MMTSITPLQTPRLLLRKLALDDAPHFYPLLTTDDVARGVLNLPYPYPAGAAEDFIRHSHQVITEGQYIWGIICRQDSCFLGVISLHPNTKHHHAEMGYWLGKPFWSQGYTTEAAHRVLYFGFMQLKLQKIFAQCFADNLGSERVQIKIGLQYEGTRRQHYFHHYRNEYLDVKTYGLVRDDFLATSHTQGTHDEG